MSTTPKQLENLTKQNDAIYSSLVARNISFSRILMTDASTDEDRVALLQLENKQLKEIIKN